MNFADFIDILETITKDYGSFASGVTGVLSLIVTVLFGGKLFQKLVKHRMDHLEGQLDNANQQISQYKAELEAQKARLEVAESDRNAVTAKLARVRLASRALMIKMYGLRGRLSSQITIMTECPKAYQSC